MASIRVTSSGPGTKLGAAAIPVVVKDAGAWQGRGLITWRRTAPAPPPAAVPQSYNRALHRSSDAPNQIHPEIYFLHGRQAATPPVSWVSDNQMPVPAVDPRGRPAVMARRPVILGQRQVVQPSPASSYPDFNRRARNG
jgi:hypothetical protein